MGEREDFPSLALLESLTEERLREFFLQLDDAFTATSEFSEKRVCVICLAKLLLRAWEETGELSGGS